MDELENEASLAIEDSIDDGDLDTLKTLITEEPTRITWTAPFGTWLHLAAMRGQMEIVKFLVAQKIDINRRGGPGDNAPICWAAARGHSEIVQFLVQAGAELDVSESVRNPLFYAITGRSIQSAKYLLEGGIDARVRYSGQRMKNMDAIGHAEERGEKEIAALIRDFLEKHPEESKQK